MLDRPASAPIPARGYAIEQERLADLRRRAASRLSGAAAAKGSVARAADALTVLYELASCPETAADALTLLHELQVYQIELDMQAQEMHESRAELESALRRQLVLYDHQPAGCFTVDASLAVHELNQTGANMLGLARDDTYGMPLDTFFCTDDAQRFRSVVSGFAAGQQQPPCLLKLRAKSGHQRQVLASISADPAGTGYLVSFCWPCASAAGEGTLP